MKKIYMTPELVEVNIDLSHSLLQNSVSLSNAMADTEPDADNDEVYDTL